MTAQKIMRDILWLELNREKSGILSFAKTKLCNSYFFKTKAGPHKNVSLSIMDQKVKPHIRSSSINKKA